MATAAPESQRRARAKGKRRDRNGRPGVNRWQTPRQKRKAGREPRANHRDRIATPGICRGQHAATETRCRARAEGKPPRQRRDAVRAPMANRRARDAMPGVNRGQTAATETEGWTQTEGRSLQQKRKAGHAHLPHPDSEFRITSAVPPRAHTPVPELKPAKRNASPANNSRAYENRRGRAASARNIRRIGSAKTAKAGAS